MISLEMRRVLFIAYHYPPIGGGGVQRNAKFARYLPRHGYQPVVVTGPGGATDRWTPEDASLLNEVDDIATVHRVAGPEPELPSGLRSAAERRLSLRSAFDRWWVAGAEELGVEVGRGCDLIYASLVPYETAEAAAALARRLGKPWIADLQDPWALDEMWLYPTTIHRKFDLRRMRRLLGSTAAIIMNTPEAADRVQRAFPELRERVVVSITNGFDQSDFDTAPAHREDERFRIVHTGYLHTDQGYRLRRTQRMRRIVGGLAAPIDILTRSHVFLLEALERVIGDRPELADVIELVLAGVTTPLDREIADRSQVRVQVPGYLAHGPTIALMRSADLLFLPMHDLPFGFRAGLTPGKTYEYLASRRPILAAVPEGDARDLLLEAGSARVCSPSDVVGMSEALHEAIHAWERGDVAATPREDVLEQYERRRLTADLAHLFGRVLGGDWYAPQVAGRGAGEATR